MKLINADLLIEKLVAIKNEIVNHKDFDPEETLLNRRILEHLINLINLCIDTTIDIMAHSGSKMQENLMIRLAALIEILSSNTPVMEGDTCTGVIPPSPKELQLAKELTQLLNDIKDEVK